jgi:hypothetical protein
MSTPAASIATPFQEPTSAATEFQALSFLIAQRLRQVQTMIVVEVMAVHGGGVGPVGTVDVLPLVDQVDGAGKAVPHTTIYGRPYQRIQGGNNAFVIDPVEGDLGVCVFASRDISAVIASKSHGPPPSNRRFSYADGVYLPGTLNGTPQNYLSFDNAGNATLLAVNSLTLNAGGKIITIDSSGITIDGILWETHYHPGVQSGGSDTGPPE